MHSSHLTSILDSSRELSEPIRVSGIHSSAKALLIVRYSQFFKKNSLKRSPIILICPQDEAALELSFDIECIARTLDRFSIKISHLPTWEQSPYSSVALSLKT